jgi:hypothetical protein
MLRDGEAQGGIAHLEKRGKVKWGERERERERERDTFGEKEWASKHFIQTL